MAIVFESLTEHPELVQCVREIYWQEWSDSLKKEFDLQTFDEYQLSADIQYYVALQDGKLVGTIGLAPLDLNKTDSCAHLTPWMSYVCVLPAYRNHKVATRMITWFLATVTVRPLYLWCKHSLVPFYTRFGFTNIESRADINIMQLNPTL